MRSRRPVHQRSPIASRKPASGDPALEQVADASRLGVKAELDRQRRPAGGRAEALRDERGVGVGDAADEGELHASR